MSNAIIIYCILNFVILFLVSRISYPLNLVDIPNIRKVHTEPVAFTGGIAISIILLFAIFLFNDFHKSLGTIISIGFLVSFLGLIDDKYNLNTGGKLSLQVIPIFYVVVSENLVLNQIGNYNYFIIDLGTFAVPFTLLSVLFLINSFNYFDGIDGSLGCSTISVLLILIFLVSQNNNHVLMLEQDIKLFLIVIIMPIVFFLIFNFSFLNLPKLFLGDSGSLFLGFIVSFVLIYFANQNLIHPILLAWSVVIFAYEFLSLNIIRVKNRQRIFEPGQDHLHHLLLKKTKSIFFTNILLFISNVGLFIVGYLSFIYLNEFISFLFFITFFLLFLFLRYSIQKNN